VLGKTDMHVLMRNIATVLADKCPPRTVLARLDAGDFIILVPDADSESCQALISQLENLQSTLQSLIPSGLTLTFNLGAAIITDEAPDAETIMIRARQHQTLKRHQNQDKNSQSASGATLELLRQALHDDTLLLVYQPTVSLKADNREFYEIRIRLPMADRMCYPEEFLGLANQYGYGERIDRYVITHALRILNHYANDDLRLIINLTANSILSQTLLLWLTQELQRQKQSPRQLILQISELDIMSTPDSAKKLCQQIRDLGFELSLTHFGCSLDPFRMLGLIQVDYVKLDKSLLQSVDIGADSRELLHQIVDQLHSQGVRVIAPMIEDIELLPLLWQANINFVQGNCLQQPSEQLEFGMFQEEEITMLPAGVSADLIADG
jgi:multidomain signaling protein FimX